MSAVFEDITTAAGFTRLVKINKLGSDKAAVLARIYDTGERYISMEMHG
jgi:hypothetical protein